LKSVGAAEAFFAEQTASDVSTMILEKVTGKR